MPAHAQSADIRPIIGLDYSDLGEIHASPCRKGWNQKLNNKLRIRPKHLKLLKNKHAGRGLWLSKQ